MFILRHGGGGGVASDRRTSANVEIRIVNFLMLPLGGKMEKYSKASTEDETLRFASNLIPIIANFPSKSEKKVCQIKYGCEFQKKNGLCLKQI